MQIYPFLDISKMILYSNSSTGITLNLECLIKGIFDSSEVFFIFSKLTGLLSFLTLLSSIADQSPDSAVGSGKAVLV